MPLLRGGFRPRGLGGGLSAGGPSQARPARAAGRALTVVQLLPALESGGVERGTLEIAEALVRAGHRSIVVSAGGRLVAPLEAGGTRHVALAIGRKHPAVLATIPRLRGLLRELGADIVHARSRLPAWVAWRALRGLEPRPAFVTTLHGLNSVSRYSAIMTRGDRVIAVSETARDYWQQHYPALDPARVVVIHRGIEPADFPFGHRPDTAWLERFHRDAAIPAAARILCLPGRVTSGKGAMFLPPLLASLPSDVFGLLVGSGSERELGRVLRLADEAGVADRFRWLPARADVRDVMARATIVLSLSRKPESFGRTVVEALALGRPVVGFAHGGVGEILARLYPAGRVPPGDLDALVTATRRLLAAPAPVPDEQPYRRERLESETLALYAELAAA